MPCPATSLCRQDNNAVQFSREHSTGGASSLQFLHSPCIGCLKHHAAGWKRHPLRVAKGIQSRCSAGACRVHPVAGCMPQRNVQSGTSQSTQAWQRTDNTCPFEHTACKAVMGCICCNSVPATKMLPAVVAWAMRQAVMLPHQPHDAS